MINVNAATESVALIVALNLTIRTVDNTMASLCSPSGFIHYNLLMANVKPKITKKETKVPISPYINMYLIFLKNYFFFKLYPPEKIMGGSNARKNSY